MSGLAFERDIRVIEEERPQYELFLFHLENCGWVVDLSRVILEIQRGGSNIRIQRSLCGCLVKSLLNYWHFQNFIFRATESGWMVDLKTELIIKSSLPQSVGCNYEEK